MVGEVMLSQSNQLYAMSRPKTMTHAHALKDTTAQIFAFRGTGPKSQFALLRSTLNVKIAMLTAARRIMRHFSLNQRL